MVFTGHLVLRLRMTVRSMYSGRESKENAKIYTLDQNTAAATFVMDGPAHVNDLTYVSEAICSFE